MDLEYIRILVQPTLRHLSKTRLFQMLIIKENIALTG